MNPPFDFHSIGDGGFVTPNHRSRQGAPFRGSQAMEGLNFV